MAWREAAAVDVALVTGIFLGSVVGNVLSDYALRVASSTAVLLAVWILDWLECLPTWTNR